MNISEPATVATDYLVSLLAGYLAWRLRRTSAMDPDAVRDWHRVFALTALAAFVGGSYHGFAPAFPGLAPGWWRLTLLVVAAVGGAMDVAFLRWAGQSTNSLWRSAVITKQIVFAAAILCDPRFVFALAAYGASLVAWGIAAGARRPSWAGAWLAGLAASVVGGVVQQQRLAPSPHLNHNDVYHLLQAVALLAFYRAARGIARSRAPGT